MRSFPTFAALGALIAISTGVPAYAHIRSESHSAWEFDGVRANLTVTVPDIEIERLAPGKGRPTDRMVEDYLLERMFPIAGGIRCPVALPAQAMAATPGYRKFHFTFVCSMEKRVQIHSDAFFDLVSSHINFAQVQTADGDFTEQLLSANQRTIDISGGSGSPLQKAPFIEFVRMGMMHIFTGVDHMSFLLGLVLISRRMRDLVFVVTGFTLGHSLTLGLAVTGVLRPHAEYIDALVALTIALIGAENAAVATRKPEIVATGLVGLLLIMGLARFAGFGVLPPLLLLGAALFGGSYLLISGHLRDAGRVRMIITVVFGLIHGFGFASNLTELRLPNGHLFKLLVGFNLGVEVGQLTLILSTVLLVALLSRLKLALPRPIVVDASAAFLVGLGSYWFVSRSF